MMSSTGGTRTKLTTAHVVETEGYTRKTTTEETIQDVGDRGRLGNRGPPGHGLDRKRVKMAYEDDNDGDDDDDGDLLGLEAFYANKSSGSKSQLAAFNAVAGPILYHNGLGGTANPTSASYTNDPDFGLGELGDGGQTSGEYISIQDIHDKLSGTDDCWGCVHCFKKQSQPGKNAAVDEMMAYYLRNEATMSREDLAHGICVLFEKNVYGPLTKQKKPCLAWTEAQILQHLRHHMQNVEGVMSDMFFEMREVQATIVNKLLKRDGVLEKVNFEGYDKMANTLIKLGAALGKANRM